MARKTLPDGWLSGSLTKHLSILPDMPCKLIIGNRGSGKSIGAEPELIQIATEEQFAVISFDAPGTLARRMVGHLSANGMEDRTEFEYVAPKDGKFLSWQFYSPSTAKDPIVRANEIDLAIEEAAQPFYAKKNMKATDDKPLIKKWIVNMLRMWGSQPTFVPFQWLEFCFRPGTDEYQYMIRNCLDKDVVYDFDQVAFIKERNPVQYQMEVGAAARMAIISRSPGLWAHHGNTFSWRQFLLDKKQVFFDLSGVPQDVARAFAIFGCNSVVNECRRYFNETGKPLPVVIVLEEAGALDLVTPLIITAMQELRKAGVFVYIISQTIMDFQDQAKFEQLMALTDEHVYYRANSGIKRIAEDLAAPTYDSKEVHYTTERLEHDGYEKIQTSSKSTGVQKPEFGPGKRISTNENSGAAYLSKYRRVTDNHYKTVQIHDAEWEKKVSTLQPFERIVRDLSGVREETVIPCFGIWPLGMSEMVIQQAIERIRQRPHYQPPKTEEPKKSGAAARFGGN